MASPKPQKRQNISPPSGLTEESTKKQKTARIVISNGAPTTTTSTTPNPHEAYTTWATAQGVTLSNVGPEALPGRGIGLVATGPIKAQQGLITVPEPAMLKPPPGFLKQHGLLQASPQAQLAAYLTLSARVPTSEREDWYAESRAVWPSPEDLKGCLLAWSSEGEYKELVALAPPSIVNPLERLMRDLRRDREAVAHLAEKLEEGEKGEWEDDYLYHWFLVNTRSFHWKPLGMREGSMVMCPVLDYMNHCCNGQGCTVTVSTDGYELKADRDYENGEEILATYGAHPNDKLLVHYGFVLPHPSADDEIRLDEIVMRQMTEAQKEALQDVGFLGGYAIDPNTNELCFKTQVAVRSLILTANEWEHFMGSGEDLAADKESEVKEWLKPHLESYLKKAEDAIDSLEKAREAPSESTTDFHLSKLKLLQERWAQIAAGLTNFLDEESSPAQ